MIFPVSRMYSDAQKAHDMANKLTENGFAAHNLFVMTPEDRSDAVDENTAQAIMSGIRSEMQHHEAMAYARKMVDGCSLLVCNAEFGFGELARRIMDSGDPIDVGYIPSIAKRKPSPLSDFFGIPTLSPQQRLATNGNTGFTKLTDGRPWFGGLTSSNATFSSKIGLPLLTSHAATLSGRLGMPLLKNPNRG